MTTTDAYRACPLCGTRNPYYTLVCRNCGRSLRGVRLVGSPPPGVVVEDGSRRGLRVALGLFALVGATAAAVLAMRLLRPSSFEAAAAAAPEPPAPEATATPIGWETLEKRLAGLPPPPVPDASPAPAAPPPPTARPAPATPAPTATPSLRPRAAPRPTPTPEAVQEDVREARRAALRAAEQELRTLERRAADLRERLREAESRGEDPAQLQDELGSVQLQIEDAERAILRAEWALREVEEP